MTKRDISGLQCMIFYAERILKCYTIIIGRNKKSQQRLMSPVPVPSSSPLYAHLLNTEISDDHIKNVYLLT